MTLGFEAAGFDVLACVDSDPLHLATHEWNFPKSSVICADVATINSFELRSAAEKNWYERYPDSEWPGDVDCVFGGPSCQGFSEIGKRDPRDGRNELVLAFARVVSEIRPRFFVMENVPGMLDPRNAATVEAAVRRVEAAGYDVLSGRTQILNAADYGVPQNRRRVFIIGARRGERPPSLPEPISNCEVVRAAISDLVVLERYSSLMTYDAAALSDRALRALEDAGSAYSTQLRSAPGTSGHWALAEPRDFERAFVTSCGRTRHRVDVAARFATTPLGAEEPISRLPRLHPDRPATTLRAGTGRDHGSFTSARPIHYTYPRVITVREAARLHSFPDWFRFHVRKWHGFRQIGNAVPPLLAKVVAEAIVKTLDVRPTVAPVATSPSRRSSELLEMSLTEAAEYYAVPTEQLPKDSRRPPPRAQGID